MRRPQLKSGTGRGDAIIGTKRKPAPLLAIYASVFKKPVVVSFQFSAARPVSSFVALSFLVGGRLQMFPHPAAAAFAGGE
jgi:hypothetical protein